MIYFLLEILRYSIVASLSKQLLRRRAEIGANLLFLLLGAPRGSDDLLSCKHLGPGETDEKKSSNRVEYNKDHK